MKALYWPRTEVPQWPKDITIGGEDHNLLMVLAIYREAWSQFADDRYQHCLHQPVTLARKAAWMHVRRKSGYAVLDDTQLKAHVHEVTTFLSVQPPQQWPVGYPNKQLLMGRVREVYDLEPPYVAERILQEEGFRIPQDRFAVH